MDNIRGKITLYFGEMALDPRVLQLCLTPTGDQAIVLVPFPKRLRIKSTINVLGSDGDPIVVSEQQSSSSISPPLSLPRYDILVVGMVCFNFLICFIDDVSKYIDAKGGKFGVEYIS